MPERVGVVAALRRYPVKSMHGERLHTATVDAAGVLGDRAFGVVDRDSGEIIRGKTPDLGPRLLACRAVYAAAPDAGHELPPVVIELPDGARVRSDSGEADEVLTRYFGRAVVLVSSAPPQSAFVAGRGDFLEEVGLPAAHLEGGSLLDAMPVSVLTTSTLDRLGLARPETSFDERRFRMNVVVATTVPGFLENDWPGRSLQLGGAVRLLVVLPTPRCVLTTMAQEDLPRDPAVLRTAARENSLEIAGRPYPSVGAYTLVEAAGEISAGDVVSLVEPREEP